RRSPVPSSWQGSAPLPDAWRGDPAGHGTRYHICDASNVRTTGRHICDRDNSLLRTWSCGDFSAPEEESRLQARGARTLVPCCPRRFRTCDPLPAWQCTRRSRSENTDPGDLRGDFLWPYLLPVHQPNICPVEELQGCCKFPLPQMAGRP